jgi:hypothetical protein
MTLGPNPPQRDVPSDPTVVCPGCGSVLPAHGLGPDDRYHVSGECLEAYWELTAYTQSKGDATFIHQHVVDAFGAQHVGPRTRPVLAVFTLVGLCLAVEHGFTGRQVQLAHMALARTRKDWPRLEAPGSVYDIHATDVLAAESGEARDAMIAAWMRAVWMAWAHEHDWVRGVCGPLHK